MSTVVLCQEVGWVDYLLSGMLLLY